MKKMRFKHIGVDSFFAMRKKLLSDFEIAKQQAKDDAAKVEPGNVGESVVRKWLDEFLPKRFGICKGYIITSNLYYDGPMEEWDIIIYDALEAPTLFTRKNGEETKTAIPVEYVRGVIEVKSALNKKSAEKAVKKLEKLKIFIGANESQDYPKYFTPPFISSIIFFEIGIKTFKQYRASLDFIAKMYQETDNAPFMGALVLKSSKNQNHTGYLKAMKGDTPILEEPIWEMSTPFKYPDNKFGCFGTFGYGVNAFPDYVFDLLKFLKGEHKMGFASSFYGMDFENAGSSRLFH